jgi:AcrR family transcriptional regulator
MVEQRERIVDAASKLLAREGREALTTRAVAEAADVQVPAIYRLFGDKRGLLDEVVRHGLANYMSAKARRTTVDDPIDDLRLGWDQHVEFGLANPAVYALMSDPSLRLDAGKEGVKYLVAKIHRIALAGRLRVAEARAVALTHAMGVGTVLSLLEIPEAERDSGVATDAREAVIAAITTKSPVLKGNKTRTAAITLRAGLTELIELSDAERRLLDEWLARVTGD